MAKLSNSLNATLENIQINAPSAFQRGDVEPLRLRLEREADGYPCLRCENASWLIPWNPSDQKKGREFGCWANPIHVGCKSFLTLHQFDPSEGLGFARSFDGSPFYCTAETNSSSGAGLESNERRSAFRCDTGETQSPALRRESNRG